ncbi:ATP-dependent RNA helicase RhlE [Thiohalospira halophila DSM 15071]|uniref:DEAD-box ATP-dependent RNA helicase RhpA n=1 Tax=Thiohalospira halophila DSM 15071 TaxID=1123397 RepID=A0A1I1VLA8_9GAMM|nr:DEAD/DEAH box helicase [Thiohalospira halophila]SFD82838.1 ATP-dependent RNA helicase RhlE [Thiohalospira halophila DSM 15071]
MNFTDFDFGDAIQRAITDQGYTEPTPIQAEAIPQALEGRDILASAETGTGKTAAFTMPLLQRLANAQSAGGSRRPRALVLVPTRELAAQVAESVRTYGRHLKLRSVEIAGGAAMGPQMKALREGVDVIVATPGRLEDHLQRGTTDLGGVETLVLDEADRMLDMGFLPAIERVIAKLPKERQTLLFSATFAGKIRKLANGLLNNPVEIDVARSNAAAASVTQSAYHVDSGRRRELLSHLFGEHDMEQVLVFARTKRGADRLAEQLDKDGIASTSIHGDKSQGQRNKALDRFRKRRIRCLVATDVASRGIDIDELPHVVNFDLPDNPEDYVHRIGRTGRGGSEGAAISLVCADQREQFGAIERLLGGSIPAETVTGFEPTEKAPAPRRSKGNGRGRGGNGRGNGGGGQGRGNGGGPRQRQGGPRRDNNRA